MKEFTFSPSDIHRVQADCFGHFKGFEVLVKTGEDETFKTPTFEQVFLSPEEVGTAVLLYLRRRKLQTARSKRGGWKLWLSV